MKRVIFSLSAFVAVLFLFAPSVSAQGTAPARPGFGLIDSDYTNYAKLFEKKQEPNLSPIGNERWRALYRSHRWADYAAGSEFREPMLKAQTLMGIYLTQDVDHRLSYQIETIIWNKAYLSASLAERITLDSIASYWARATSDEASDTYDKILAEKLEAVGEGDDFYSEYELDKLAMRRRDIDQIARTRFINPNSISRAMRSEVQVVRNLFDHGESYRNWVLTYHFMREKFDVLDELAAQFTFNWSDERRQAAIEGLVSDPNFRSALELKIRREKEATRINQANMEVSMLSEMSGSSGMSGNMAGGSPSYDESSGETMMMATGAYGDMPSEMMFPGMRAAETPEQKAEREEKEIQAEVDRRLKVDAANNFALLMLREAAYKYVVGVYESKDFHLGTLRRIHRYYSNAADAGDPIAQFHLALFLMYLGDIVDPFTDDATRRSEINRLLAAAEASPIAKAHVAKLREQNAIEASLADRRALIRDQKVQALWKVETDKIDMFDTVLMGVRERISSGSGVGGRMQSGMMGGMMGGGYGGGGVYGNSSGSNSGSGNGSSRSSGRSSSRSSSGGSDSSN